MRTWQKRPANRWASAAVVIGSVGAVLAAPFSLGTAAAADPVTVTGVSITSAPNAAAGGSTTINVNYTPNASPVAPPIEYTVLPDDADVLGGALRTLRERQVALVITVGGTGLGPRDITVDTVQPMLDVEIPGIMEAARAFGQQRMPFAMLSRGVAGYAGETLILTFPGSRGGASESLAATLPGLIHLLETGRTGGRHAGGYGEAG